MDDELKAIQDDLDSVLERLADYMGNESQKIEDIDPRTYSKEDAARAALRYLAVEDSTLEDVIRGGFFSEKRLKEGPSEATILGEYADHEGEVSTLIEALCALQEWLISAWVPESRHMDTLAQAVNDWSSKDGRFIGESMGLELTPRRQIDPRRDEKREAIAKVWAIHKIDPETYPIGEALFELVGEQFGMAARTVSRAYYSEDGRFGRNFFEEVSNDPELTESLMPLALEMFGGVLDDSCGEITYWKMALDPCSWRVFPDAPRLNLSLDEEELLFTPLDLSETCEN